MGKPETSLDRLHPAFRPIAVGVVALALARGLPLTVVYTLRSVAEQQALYAVGRTKVAGVWVKTGRTVTNATPDKAPHCFGLAMDACPTELLAVKDWGPTSELWAKYGAIVQECGGAWGGLWRGFADRPHCEMPNWKALR